MNYRFDIELWQWPIVDSEWLKLLPDNIMEAHTFLTQYATDLKDPWTSVIFPDSPDWKADLTAALAAWSKGAAFSNWSGFKYEVPDKGAWIPVGKRHLVEFPLLEPTRGTATSLWKKLPQIPCTINNGHCYLSCALCLRVIRRPV